MNRPGRRKIGTEEEEGEDEVLWMRQKEKSHEEHENSQALTDIANNDDAK